jgi:glycosyltransferase involved in cell wall biosynthesis
MVNFHDYQSVYTRENVEGVDTLWIKTLKYKGSGSIRRILSWIDFELKLFFLNKERMKKPDIIIVSSLSLITVLNGIWLKRKYGCKLIFEIRDIWPLTLIEEAGYSKKNPFIRLLAWVEKYGYKKADIIVGTMPNLSEHVTNITGDNKKCVCIPFGFIPELYKDIVSLPDDYVRRYIPEDKFIIGYTGSIGITNALDTLIDCAVAMKDNINIHFLIVGDGGLLDEYKRKTSGLKNITFAPKVPKSEVQAILEYCQVLYFSVKDSKVWHYGQSLNKLVDYMIAGKPIVGSYSGFPSMINEARCGSFIPANDVESLIKVINEYGKLSEDQLSAIGRRGKEWLLKNRSYDVIAAEYNHLL